MERKRLTADLLDRLKSEFAQHPPTKKGEKVAHDRMMSAASLADLLVVTHRKYQDRELFETMIKTCSDIPELAAAVIATLVTVISRVEDTLVEADGLLDKSDPEMVARFREEAAQKFQEDHRG